MGNCISPSLCPQAPEKAKVLLYNEVEKGFRASKPVKEVACGYGPYHGYELMHYSQPPVPGKVGSLLPHQMQPQHRSISLKVIKMESCQGPSITVLVSREQQLELLLRDANLFQFMKISAGAFQRGNRKWRPSLSAIPEVPDF